ncbi:MAG: DUF6618 family protein [Lachnospiraceae bacterium]|nr:DUF6618 family protein [Lachnospiraceae bacterium]
MYEVSNCKEISVNYKGSSYLVIYGEHVNGWFFCIPNFQVGGELSDTTDVFWNSPRIGKALDDMEAGIAIANGIKNNG